MVTPSHPHEPRDDHSVSVCELAFGVNVFDFDFGPTLILANNQSSAALLVLDTCLIVGLRLLNYHFHHGFGIFKDVQLRLL